MQLEVGTILEGKVSGITKFGAFVTLPEGKSGLVHISEIANSYVNEVSEHLSMGQTVKVKVISVSEEGKISLSIRKALPAPPAPPKREYAPRQQAPRQQSSGQQSARAPFPRAQATSGNQSFEDKLKQFMADSDSKNSGNRLYNIDKRSSNNRRRK